MEKGTLEDDVRQALKERLKHRSNIYGHTIKGVAGEIGASPAIVSSFLKGGDLKLSYASSLYEMLRMGTSLRRGFHPYLDSTSDHLLGKSENRIYAVGVKDLQWDGKPYSLLHREFLEAVERGVPYKRLILEPPTEGVMNHIDELNGFGNVEFRFDPTGMDNKYQNFTVIDNNVVLQMGHDNDKKKRTMEIAGKTLAEPFVEYFNEIFNMASAHTIGDISQYRAPHSSD